MSMSVDCTCTQTRVDSHFEKMFETGVDEMAWDDTVSSNSINFFLHPGYVCNTYEDFIFSITIVTLYLFSAHLEPQAPDMQLL